MTRRLVLSYLAVTIVVLVLLEVPLAVFFRQREIDRLTADVERDATVIATIYEDEVEQDRPADPATADDYRERTNARVVVVDDAGISIIDTDASTPRDLSTRPEIVVALDGRRATGVRRSDTLDTDLLYVAVPIASGGTVHGAVRLTLDTHEVSERVHRFWIGLAAVGFVILLAIAAVGSAIARSVTQPVRRLQAAADRFSSGDLSPDEIDARAPPELAALQRAMNTMAVRLDELIDRQRSFVADASHQLRTPLTALRLQLDNLESNVDAGSARQIGSAVAEVERLGVLVDDLLQLATAERAATNVVIRLADLVCDRVDTWTATADLVGVRLVAEVPSGPVEALARSGGVEQILDNVIDNALAASPPDSTVTVTVRAVGNNRDDGAWSVLVADEGRGLDDGEKVKAVTRFWRADTATPGSGLGLAIASGIAHASGGSFRLDDNHPTGLVVELTLRAAPRDR